MLKGWPLALNLEEKNEETKECEQEVNEKL